MGVWGEGGGGWVGVVRSVLKYIVEHAVHTSHMQHVWWDEIGVRLGE